MRVLSRIGEVQKEKERSFHYAPLLGRGFNMPPMFHRGSTSWINRPKEGGVTPGSRCVHEEVPAQSHATLAGARVHTGPGNAAAGRREG